MATLSLIRTSEICMSDLCMFNPLLCGQLKADSVKEVAYTRRKQHQASLQYYCALNALQYRKRVAMLEPMLGYTQAQVLTGPELGVGSVSSFQRKAICTCGKELI